MTTAEIVKALRENAGGLYRSAVIEVREARRFGFRIPRRLHRDADALRRAAKRLARLADDELAARVAKDCHDPHHDVRWCSTCEARGDGIDAYRRAVGCDA